MSEVRFPAAADWPAVLALKIDGQCTTVEYTDGKWVLDESGLTATPAGVRRRWSTAHSHCVVVRMNGVAIAIRGYRQDGIDEFDLYAIAASLTWAAGQEPA